MHATDHRRTGHRGGHRGEGYVEYVIVLSLIMICSIVGLLTAGSETIKQVQYAHGICDNCPPPSHDPHHQPGDPGHQNDPPPPGGGEPTNDPGAGTGSGSDRGSTPASEADRGAPGRDPLPPVASNGNTGGLPGDPAGSGSIASSSASSVFARIWGWFTGWI